MPTIASKVLPYVGLTVAGLFGVWALASFASTNGSPSKPRLYVDQVLKSFGQLPDGSGVDMIWLKIPKVATPEAGLMTVVICSDGQAIGREVQFTGTQPYTYDPRIAANFEQFDKLDTLVHSEIWPDEVLLDHWVAVPGFKYARVGETVTLETGDISCSVKP